MARLSNTSGAQDQIVTEGEDFDPLKTTPEDAEILIQSLVGLVKELDDQIDEVTSEKDEVISEKNDRITDLESEVASLKEDIRDLELSQ